MKIIKTANGKYKLSKKEWQNIGIQKGWIKIANKYEVIDNEFNQKNYPNLIGQILNSPPSYAHVKLVQGEKPTLQEIFQFQTKLFSDPMADDQLQDFVIKALKVGYEKDEIIKGLQKFYRQAPNAGNHIFNRTIMKLQNNIK